MKTRMVLPLVLLLLAAGANAQDARHGTLKNVTGVVTVGTGDTLRTAAPGGGVAQADRILTGPGASAALALKDGTLLMVGPDAMLELTTVQFDSTTQEGNLVVNLLKGSVRMVTGWLAKMHQEQVRVTTPTSVVDVRGTDFIVEVP